MSLRSRIFGRSNLLTAKRVRRLLPRKKIGAGCRPAVAGLLAKTPRVLNIFKTKIKRIV